MVGGKKREWMKVYSWIGGERVEEYMEEVKEKEKGVK